MVSSGRRERHPPNKLGPPAAGTPAGRFNHFDSVQRGNSCFCPFLVQTLPLRGAFGNTTHSLFSPDFPHPKSWLKYWLSVIWAHSSIGQSRGLIIPWFSVRVRVGPPNLTGGEEVTPPAARRQKQGTSCAVLVPTLDHHRLRMDVGKERKTGVRQSNAARANLSVPTEAGRDLSQCLSGLMGGAGKAGRGFGVSAGIGGD